MTRTIPFTQFLRPFGRPVETFFDEKDDTPPEIFDMADALLSAGYRFESEVLRDGTASFECLLGDDSIAITSSVYGPPVIDAVCRLVREAHEHLQAADAELLRK